MSAPHPRVDYYAMGGTIASTGSGGSAVTPQLGAVDLAASAVGLDRVADVHPHEFRLVPSPEIGITDLVELADAMRQAVADGAQGLVATQGTDTIEETAFALDLLWDLEAPVVFSGAMRNPSLPGADGPANLLAAVQLAASAEARGAGVLVCLNDEVHAARHVRKTHTSSPSTFASPGLGPIGWIAEGRPVLAYRPTRRCHLRVDPAATVPAVALLKVALGDDGRLVQAVNELGYDGVVIEAMGGGHVPTALLRPIQQLADRIPVVLTSRTGAGEVLLGTYQFPGSEMDLLERGLIRAGALDALKARILLVLGLASGADRLELARLFTLIGTTTGPVEL